MQPGAHGVCVHARPPVRTQYDHNRGVREAASQVSLCQLGRCFGVAVLLPARLPGAALPAWCPDMPACCHAATISPWPYDHGTLQNFQEVFGRDRRYWLLPMHTPNYARRCEQPCMCSLVLSSWTCTLHLESSPGRCSECVVLPACSMLDDALRVPPPPEELLGIRDTV